MFVRPLIFFLSITAGVNAQSLQLQYSGNNPKVVAAVAEANKILANQDFYKKIDSVLSFDNSTYSGLQVANEMRSVHQTVRVEDYWKPFSKANAKTQTKICINTANLKRSTASITNTLIHETVHYVDWSINRNWDYTHNGQRATGQGNTAPWVIATIGAGMISLI